MLVTGIFVQHKQRTYTTIIKIKTERKTEIQGHEENTDEALIQREDCP